MKHFFYALALLSVFLIPQVSHAQVGQQCWVKDECQKVGSFYSAKEHDDARFSCGTGEDAAGNELGFCTAAGNATTSISVGGTRAFSNLGTYIKFFYQYGVGVAGALAVIVVLIGGMQWVLSGGSPERVTSAKKRIGGAIMGLLLAVLSFTLLRTLNPALVELRLPQVWMINTQGLTPPLCSDISDASKKVVLLGPSNMDVGERATKKREILESNPKYDTEATKATCGSDFLVEPGGGQSCEGDFCEESKLCFRSVADESGGRECIPSRIAGHIRNSALADGMVAQSDSFIMSVGTDLITEFWAWEWVESIYITTVCKSDGEPDEQLEGRIEEYESKNFTQEFFFRYSDANVEKWAKACGSEDNLRGFVLLLKMNVSNNTYSEGHLVGRNGIDMCDIYPSFGVGLEGDCERTLGPNSKISDDAFFTKQELLDGFVLDIDAGPIPFIENDDSRREKHYKKYGWTPS